MSDDFGTVNIRRGERAREIELLRQHYREHRETLAKLLSEAPTQHLANEYQRLIGDIDQALAKVDEIEGRPAAPPPTPMPASTQPGTRTLVTPPSNAQAAPEMVAPVSNGRLALIVVAGLLVLGIIGFLIYRASGDRRHPVITESSPTTTTAASTIEPVTPAPASGTVAAASGALTAAPAIADYGTIRKGTRATRQVEVANSSGAPVRFKVSRSQCKCLFYEYKDTIPPKQKETITVTVDGARAKAGSLIETIDVTSATDPSMTTSFKVSATIK